ncbi:hypothetical protein EVAR_6541_1 [Eumeta japonica]|uniref:Uncharacterized protein n=1 Tax=Eumeta variegata TaxID=151549 RepID=A0A4C1STG4_EUMVA|nr:hypothetical protein EVAR_6541_1 [Eumeta japonica]
MWAYKSELFALHSFRNSLGSTRYIDGNSPNVLDAFSKVKRILVPRFDQGNAEAFGGPPGPEARGGPPLSPPWLLKTTRTPIENYDCRGRMKACEPINDDTSTSAAGAAEAMLVHDVIASISTLDCIDIDYLRTPITKDTFSSS